MIHKAQSCRHRCHIDLFLHEITFNILLRTFKFGKSSKYRSSKYKCIYIQLYSCFFRQLWAKSILLVIHFYIHSASIFCKEEMVIDSVSLGMLCLVVFMGCQIQSFCSPITLIALHCPNLLICFNPITY